jgi:hypothetical protein
VRAGYGLMRGGGLEYPDEEWYWAMSRSLIAGAGLVGEFDHRAERMPLYPWLLSFFSDPRGARAVQWAVGALAAALVCMLAGRACRRPWIAGLFVAFDPTLVGSASLILSETLAVTAVAGLWLAGWPLRNREACTVQRWAAVAVMASLCVYARESLALFVAALLVFLMAVRRDRWCVLGAAAVALIVAASLVPWGMRNQRVLGQWYWFTTRGGISLYDGVRPGATGASDLADIKDDPAVEGLDEVAWDAYFRGAARRTIAEEPGRVAALAPVKLARTWSPVLHAAEYSSRAIQLIFALWYVPLYLLILLGVWARRHDCVTVVGLLLPALCVSGLHAVFVGSVRYRLVALPALAVLAALGACWLWTCIRRAPDATEVKR